LAEDISPERVVMFAAAARVPLSADASPRIARVVTPTVGRFAAGPIDMPFETEPSTFVAVQHKDAAR
jgi:hypothetical protein